MRWTFVAMIILEIGLYFLLKNFDLFFNMNMNTLPFFFIMFGIAFMVQAKAEKDDQAIVPAVLLLGLGIHFLWGKSFPFWPDDLTAMIWIIALAFIIRSAQAKSGFAQGFILLLIGSFLYYFPSALTSFIQKSVSNWQAFWPILFVIAGLYLLFFRKK